MLNKKALSALSVTADPNFKNVTLLLQGDGTNGAQNNTFLDSSSNNFTITRNGNTTQGSLNPYGDRWSNYFDGTGDYLTVSGGMPSGAGTAFTMECWIYLDNISNYRVITRGDSSPQFDWGVTSSGAINLDNTGVANICASANGSIKANTWHHVAVTRSTGNIYKLWIDGVNAATSAAYTTSMTANTTIGYSSFSSSNYFTGYISNFRVVNSEVYTAAFTPPAAPLTAITNTSLLTCQSNRFIDNSSNNFTITRNGDVSVRPFSPFAPSAPYSTSANGGSGYFDGTGDWLNRTTGSIVDFGANNYTVEYWLYLSSDVASFSYAQVVGPNDLTANGIGFGLTYRNSRNEFYATSWTTAYTTNIECPKNAWVHVAWVRSGTSVQLYRNGTLQTTLSITNNYTDAGVGVGGFNSAAYLPACFVSNLRVVRGTALYTAAFTPPTAPLTAITNTSLLLNFTNGGIVDSAADNVLETVGNAQISTSVKKYGTGSLAFDGSGDGLLAPHTIDLNIGTGDFTIETWVNRTSAISGAGLADMIVAKGTNDIALEIEVNTGKFRFVQWGVVILLTSTTVVSNGTWYHVAITRSGTTFRMFVNGTQEASTTSSINFTSTNRLSVGADLTNTSQRLNGYIDDLRITKGVARYTANFTPPAAPLPNQ